MKTINFFSVAVMLSALLLSSCSKDDDPNPNATESKAPFFVSGKGFRHVHTLSEPTAGKISFFNSLDLSYTEDGKLHWVYERTNPFAQSNFLYRSVIDAKTGDNLPVSGKAADNLVAGYSWRNNASDINHGDFLAFVPYTGNLYLSYQSKARTMSVDGDVPHFEYLDYSFLRQPLYAANGDLYMSFCEMTSIDIATTYQRLTMFNWHNTVKKQGNVTKTVWTYMNTNLDSVWHKGTSFPVGNNGEFMFCTFDRNLLYLYDEAGNILSTTPFAGQKFPDLGNAQAADVKWYAKMSKDFTKTALMCIDEDRSSDGGPHYNSFVVDHIAKKIKVVVNQKKLRKVIAADFDTEGNIYYTLDDESKPAEVSKISSGNVETIVGAGFIGMLKINKLYALNGKVYATVTSTAKEGYDNLTKLTLLESN
ncbi:MAG: hypothetical protein KA172_06105 [Paludibacter sp.]|nr:hypothetical protein [Paludibacter sp.]